MLRTNVVHTELVYFSLNPGHGTNMLRLKDNTRLHSSHIYSRTYLHRELKLGAKEWNQTVTKRSEARSRGRSQGCWKMGYDNPSQGDGNYIYRMNFALDALRKACLEKRFEKTLL